LVAVLGCGVDYASGLYRVTDLSTPRVGPDKQRFPSPRAPLGDPEQYRSRVIALAIDTFCPQPGVPNHVEVDFERVARRGERWGRGVDIWLRKAP
jgi:hypothetical protein